MDGPVDSKAAYEQARKELLAALHKKRAVDKSLAIIEQSLYNFEGNYLAETSLSGGNIITGFDAYLKPSAANKKRHGEITDADRIFSNSSESIQRSLEMQIGPSTPPPTTSASFHHPSHSLSQSQSQTVVSLQAGEGGASSRRGGKRARREGTKGTSDGEESVVAVPTRSSRPGKRVRTGDS